MWAEFNPRPRGFALFDTALLVQYDSIKTNAFKNYLMLQISGKMAVITSVSVAMQSAPPVPNTNCTDCPIVTNWLQHKNPCRHICPTCAPLISAAK